MAKRPTPTSAPVEQEDLTFTIGGGTPVTVSLAAGTTIDQAISQINGQVGSQGVYAVKNVTGRRNRPPGHLCLYRDFRRHERRHRCVRHEYRRVADGYGSRGERNARPATRLWRWQAINQAVTLLGTVQGKVGAGENDLQYAIQLAQSQVSNFSAAESQIRDADIATEAANLTKAQVLEQSSVAALAQANSAPQALLKLLQ